MKSMIRVHNLTYAYEEGWSPALKELNLLIGEGEYIAVIGPNGCGKTTLIRHFNALLLTLNRQGMGIIHVTHSMEEAALADRVLVMDRGELIADGSPSDILSQVEWLKSLGLAPPHITELMWQLQLGGEDVDTSIFTIDAAVEELTALLARLRTSSNADKLRKADGHV